MDLSNESVRNFQAKVVQLLPKYRGTRRENPHRHLYEIHAICSNMKSPKDDLESMKRMALRLSLADFALSWFQDQDAKAMDTWDKMQNLFIEKFHMMLETPQVNSNMDSLQATVSPTPSTLQAKEAPQSLPVFNKEAPQNMFELKAMLETRSQRIKDLRWPVSDDEEDDEFSTPSSTLKTSDLAVLGNAMIWKLYEKVKVNVPLLNDIRKMPRYHEFLWRVFATKRDLEPLDKEEIDPISASLIKGMSLKKIKEAGMVIIPCVIGKSYYARALFDFFATRNIMPYHVYQSLNLGSLDHSSVTFESNDGFTVRPRGVLENVLVQVNGLVFPVDFDIVDMGEARSTTITPLILGLSFLKTSKAKIDVNDGHISMEFDGIIADFEAPKDPNHSVYEVRMVDTNQADTQRTRRMFSSYPWRLIPKDPP